MTDRCHCEHSFCHCEHSFLSLRTLFFVIANTLFCHSERSEESSAWMLCFAQHDKLVDACALFSMTATAFLTLLTSYSTNITSDGFVTSGGKLCIAEIEHVTQRLFLH
jgi:hypothetical protein